MVTIILVAIASGIFGGLIGSYLVLRHVAKVMNREAKKWDDLRVTVKIPEGFGLVNQ